MTQVRKTYPNGVVRDLRVLDVARTDDVDMLSVSVENEGVICILRGRDADVWQQLETAGLVPA